MTEYITSFVDGKLIRVYLNPENTSDMLALLGIHPEKKTDEPIFDAFV